MTATATTIVTTAGTPPAGIYWQAVIYGSFQLTVEPTLASAQTPTGEFNLDVTPHFVTRGPSTVALKVAALLKMIGGTTEAATATLRFTPTLKMSTIPAGTSKLSVTPSISMSGAVVPRTPPRQSIDVAVQRAANW